MGEKKNRLKRRVKRMRENEPEETAKPEVTEGGELELVMEPLGRAEKIASYSA